MQQCSEGGFVYSDGMTIWIEKTRYDFDTPMEFKGAKDQLQPWLIFRYPRTEIPEKVTTTRPRIGEPKTRAGSKTLSRS